jgi:hypothetical protein
MTIDVTHTWENDIDDKLMSYGVLGVQEYLVFDPTGEFPPGQVRAWRAGQENEEPWSALPRPDGAVVWRSEILGLDVRVEGTRLRFDDPKRGPLPALREAVSGWQESEERALSAEQRAVAAEQELAALRERLQQLEECGHPND